MMKDLLSSTSGADLLTAKLPDFTPPKDGGATWVKLNEDDYTMGGVRAIYGDNNRYGTVLFLKQTDSAFVYCEIAE